MDGGFVAGVVGAGAEGAGIEGTGAGAEGAAPGTISSARSTHARLVLVLEKGMRSSAQQPTQWMTSPLQARSHSMCWPHAGHSNFTALISFPPLFGEP